MQARRLLKGKESALDCTSLAMSGTPVSNLKLDKPDTASKDGKEVQISASTEKKTGSQSGTKKIISFAALQMEETEADNSLYDDETVSRTSSDPDMGIQLKKFNKHEMINLPPLAKRGSADILEDRDSDTDSLPGGRGVNRRRFTMSIKYIQDKAFTPYTKQETDEIYALVGIFVLLGLSYAFLVFAFGADMMVVDGDKVFVPGSAGWAMWLLWICSLLSGQLAKKYGIPPLLVNLIVGIILKNLPGDPVDGLPDSWATFVRSTGLSLILMRSGLELDVPMVMRQGWIAARLTVCPGFVEAFVCGGISMALFGMPIALGLALGFILAAVSPAVVVSGMFNLQKKGYGVAKGIPSLIVAAASFDDVVAISGYSICISAAIHTGHDATLSYIEGPLNVIAGVIIGVMGGTICGMSRVFNSALKRTCVVIFMGLFLMHATLYLHYHGAGALGSLVTTIVASYCWQNGTLNEYIPWFQFSKPANPDWHHETEHDLATLWDYIASPLLFAVIGASIDFAVIDASMIPLGLLVVVCGMAVRVPTAILVTGGKDLTFIERCFVGCAWIPKATVQAALGSVPLDIILTSMDEDDAHYDEYVEWGQQILVTAVVAILLTAPIGLVCINVLGEKWLTYDLDNIKDEEVEQMEPEVADSQDDNGDNTGGDGNINNKRLVSDLFIDVTGLSSPGDSKRREEEASMGRLKKKLYGQADRPLMSWEKFEQRRRMTKVSARELNKRLSVHFFHRLTTHVEFLEACLMKIQENEVDITGESNASPPKDPNASPSIQARRRPSLEQLATIVHTIPGMPGDTDNPLDLEKMIHSARVLMEGIMACYKIVDDQKEKFPVESLYKMVRMDEEHIHNKINAKAKVDPLTGKVLVDKTEKDDPLEDQLLTLKRRDTDIQLSVHTFASREKRNSDTK